MDEPHYVSSPSLNADSVVVHHMDYPHSMKLFAHNKKKQNLDHSSMNTLFPMMGTLAPKCTRATTKRVLFALILNQSFITEQCLYICIHIYFRYKYGYLYHNR